MGSAEIHRKAPSLLNMFQVATYAVLATTTRILCLHGGGSSEAIMRMQTAKLRAALRGDAEFDFLEAERLMPQNEVDPRLRARFGDDASYYNWYSVCYDGAGDGPLSLDYVDALQSESVQFSYPGAEAAMTRVKDKVCKSGPYSALLGFSQGAILITLLTATMLRHGELPSWRCNICVCGMPVRANEYRHLFDEPLSFPCIVAQGTDDPFYPWAVRLRDNYLDCDFIEFEVHT